MKVKKIWYLFIPLCIVAMLGAFLGIDSTANAVKYIPIVATGVYIVASLILTGFNKQPMAAYRFNSNMLAGLSQLLLGTLMAVDFFKSMKELNQSESGYFYIFNVILMLLTGLIFITLGLESAIPKIGKKMSKLSLIMLIPSAYYSTRLVIKFLSYTTSAVAGTDMMDLIYIALILLFVFYFTVMYVGFENNGTVKYMYVFGFAAVILCLSHSLAYLYGLHKSGVSMSLNNNIRVYEDVLMCVYIVAHLYETTKHIYTQTRIEEPEEEMSEEDKKFERIIEEYDMSETIREELDLTLLDKEPDLPNTTDKEIEDTDISNIEDKINKLIDDIFDEENK